MIFKLGFYNAIKKSYNSIKILIHSLNNTNTNTFNNNNSTCNKLEYLLIYSKFFLISSLCNN